MAFSWICPFCTRPTTLTNPDSNSGGMHLFKNSRHGNVGINWISYRCPNPECCEIYIRVIFKEWSSVVDGLPAGPGRALESWTLRPESSAKPLPDYIPSPIREDYYEACLIAEKSPKASATLSRRCLQGMIRDYWKINKKTLYEEINALEERVDPSTWESIDAVRQVGNIGAHMEKDINHIVSVDPKEAQLLIGMIEQLVDDWYVQRFERKQRTKDMIRLADEKKEQKQKTQSFSEAVTESK